MTGTPTILFGPQRDFHEIRAAISEIAEAGPIALVTAGWQENESEDGALAAAVGRPTVNLRLHARSEEAFRDDPELGELLSARQSHLQRLQQFYRIRLDFTDDAAQAIGVRHVEAELLAEQAELSVLDLRHHDEQHVMRVAAVHREYDERIGTDERPVVQKHRAEIAEQLAGCGALVVTGGHVASLINRLNLFGVLGAAASKPVVAWSAGAMTLTDRVVLFHDFPPFGKNVAELLEPGFGRCPGVVVMPDASARVDLSDHEGMVRFAQRMAPARCMTLDRGHRLVFDGPRLTAIHAGELSVDGVIRAQGDA